MLVLKTNKKQGFTSHSPVFITLLSGEPFLFVATNKNFTLPSGVFVAYGNFTASEFSHLDGKTAPTPEKRKALKRHNVTMQINPHKLSINVGNGQIYIDKVFWAGLNEVQKYFTLGHELGHYKYFDEMKADRFAALLLLKKGFNPSQIIAAANTTLSDFSEARKTALYNFLKLKK